MIFIAVSKAFIAGIRDLSGIGFSLRPSTWLAPARKSGVFRPSANPKIDASTFDRRRPHDPAAKAGPPPIRATLPLIVLAPPQSRNTGGKIHLITPGRTEVCESARQVRDLVTEQAKAAAMMRLP